MKRVTLSDYTNFAMDYASGSFQTQRFGQAFMNYFYNNTTLVDPALFYCENRSDAVEMIFSCYIDLESVS